MYRLKKEDMFRIAPFFDGWEETLLWSCLQGYMGNAWTDNIENPQSAQIVTGDFCFFAGKPDIELVKNVPESFPSKYILMIPENDAWAELIEQAYKDRSHKFMRYAIKKEPDVFDREKLKAYIERLPAGYVLRRINEELFHRVLKEEWSRCFCSEFEKYEDYAEYGLGFVVLDGDQIISGASSYTVYNSGIEIEIDTREDYRRKGLALVCASKLILECLDRNLYPSWDAANRESVALSEKLGYHFDKEYVTYSVSV